MKALSAVAFAFLAVRSAAAAFAPTGALLARAPAPAPTTVVGYGVTGSSSDDDGDDDSSGSTSTNTTSSSSTTSQKGDSKCVSTMCVEALVNGDTVQYTLTSQRSSVGYMAMGFGSQMARVPMVIMWANDDGSITLSQRQASGEVEPSVVASPPRVASLQDSLSVATGSNPKFVYTIPANSDTQQTIIWAFGTTKPASSATDARLVQHIAQGTMTLNLANVISSGADTSDSGSGSSSSGAGALTSRQKMIFAHGIIATLGFILFLPIGALIPRYLRTFVNGRTWFTTHWVVQFLLAGIAIVIGVALGIAAVVQRGGSPTTTHKRVGLVLFVLYLLQVGLGAVIHWVKPRAPRKRPAQNYFHAILGIVIIALSLWQVRTGYREEWTAITGRDDVPNGINIVWYIWVVLLPVLYAAGMAFLPKQYAQEKKARESSQGYRD